MLCISPTVIGKNYHAAMNKQPYGVAVISYDIEQCMIAMPF
jgi:hypothetical protein